MFHSKSLENSANCDTVFTDFEGDLLQPSPEDKPETVSSARKPGLRSAVLIAGLTALAGLSPWLIPNPAPA